MRSGTVMVAVATLAACATGPSAGTGATAARIPTCEPPLSAPAGWQVLPAFHEPAADHVGVRLGFRDEFGRELHTFAGIPGEFGEGLPAAGEVPLGSAVMGRLSGAGAVWVIEWDEGDPCDPRAALGNGFDRQGFLEVLEEAGIAAGPG